MTLQVNGEPHAVRAARQVAELVDELGLPAATVLVEHNGVALRRGEWADVVLAEGDRVEILKIAAGG